jgi:hypothetical protein
MLRKLVFAFIGASLGALVSLYPVVLEAQHLRVDSERDVVEVSRQVVGESLPAPPAIDGYGLWPAATTLGLGLFCGWLVWGRRHEPEVNIHQLDSILIDPDEEEDYLKPEGSLFGLNMVEVTARANSVALESGHTAQRLEEQTEDAAELPQIEWDEYSTPVQHCFPLPPAVVFEDPEPVYHCYPEYQPPESVRDWPVPEEVFEALPAHADVQSCAGMELIDIDESDDPWHFEDGSSAECAQVPVLVRR